ncbi:MAG: thrombospondin type 3 repeat-containing protein, partial [Verrucomicrobia bacterium]|nr:thrombospondin type 3 repeat-containing protein [Verrucomicrobiota bacterium]
SLNYEPKKRKPSFRKAFRTGSSSGEIRTHTTAISNAISADASSNILVNNTASLSTFFGGGIVAHSIGGNIDIQHDGVIRNSHGGTGISGKGISAVADSGSVNVSVRDTIISTGSAIEVKAANDIGITSNGEISTKSSGTSAFSPGILAISSGGKATLNSSGDIRTVTTSISDAVGLKAESDIQINNTASLSTFLGSGMIANSTNGNVEINHEGTIGVSQSGGGVLAYASAGFVNIFSNDSGSSVASRGDFNSSDAIHIEAAQSVTLHWAGDVESIGNRANAIFAKSEMSGVSVTTKGDVRANGIAAYGIFLSGPSILTANILSGSVSGADGASVSVGVGFIDGTENKVNNYGSIISQSFVAIKTGDGNETIDNHGGIYGSIDLGAGTNVIENRSGATLVTHNDLKLGAGNFLNSSGHLQMGELGQETLTTTMIGNLVMAPSASFRMEIQDTNLSDELITDKLIVVGSAVIDGEFIVSIQELYDEPKAGHAFTILTATSLTGTFSSVRVLNGSHHSAEISRKVGLELSYTETTITGTVVLLEIDSYEDWKKLGFDEAQQADELVSGSEANPDGDGLSNGDEALFGGDPLKPEGSPVSFELGDVNDPDGISISATFNVADDITDREWFFETSPNLEDWSPASVTETTMQDMGDFSKLTVDFDQPVSSEGSTFVRLKGRTISQ